MRVTEFPAPPLLPELDAPPDHVVAAHFPELVKELAVVRKALQSAREARGRFESAFPAGVGVERRPGSDWAAAVSADAAALRGKRKVEKLGALIAEQPTRYGVWMARSLLAVELVSEWNLSAPERVERDTRQGLLREERRLREAIVDAAAGALAAAAEVGTASLDVKLRASWRALAAMDEAADAWRTVLACAHWATWARPVTAGLAWRPLGAEDWPTEPDETYARPGTVTLARALRDGDLRIQLERTREPERAR